jgi:DNA-binding transcriptional ArsR family regulator
MEKGSQLMTMTDAEYKEYLDLKDAAEVAKAQQRDKAEKSSLFKRWAQFNLEETRRMMELTLAAPKAAAILFFLIDQMDDYNAVVCSVQTIQELLDLSRSTVARNIKILKDGGYMTVLKTGNANVYCVNDTVFWKSWHKNRRYAKVQANVLLTSTEQEPNYQYTFADYEGDPEFAARYDRIVSERLKIATVKQPKAIEG